MVSKSKIVFVLIVIINFYMFFFSVININEKTSVLSNEGDNPPPLIIMAFVEPIYIDDSWTERSLITGGARVLGYIRTLMS